MTVMYDSDDPAAIPAGVAAAGYCDGYAAAAWNGPDGFARFPNALRIAVFASTNDGHALDVERGDATPDQAPAWVRRRLAAGVARPWVYCNRDNRPAVEGALRAAGLTADQVALWVATLDGTETVPAGFYPVAAVQFANSAHSGGHYDLSIVNQTYGPQAGLLEAPDMTPEEHAHLVALGYRFATFLGYQFDPNDPTFKQYAIAGAPTLPQVLAELADLKGRVELIEQSPAIGAEHTTPPGP